MVCLKLGRPLVIAMVLLAVAVGTVVTAYSLHLFNLGNQSGASCPSSPTTSSSPAYFTLIMSNQGFNSSRTYTGPCPILNVAKGQSVTIHLRNDDPVEAHGFAITHYLDSGIELRPGQSNDITFTATQAGSFLVYCNILCSVHNYMQNGRLNVS